jgi:F-type H+-transporting ATPase subunit b
MAGGSESLWSWVFRFINFGVLVAILVKFGAKPFKNYFINKHIRIRQKIEEAEKIYREAETLKKQYEEKLSKLDEEIEAFKKAVFEETEKERQKIIDEAKSFAAKIKEQIQLTYEQEALEARARIKEEIARLTVEKAELLVKERFNERDNKRLIEEFIEKVRGLN